MHPVFIVCIPNRLRTHRATSKASIQAHSPPRYLYSACGISNAFQFACNTLITYPLADLARVHTMCPEIPGHPIKLHLFNNIKTILLLE